MSFFCFAMLFWFFLANRPGSTLTPMVQHITWATTRHHASTCTRDPRTACIYYPSVTSRMGMMAAMCVVRRAAVKRRRVWKLLVRMIYPSVIDKPHFLYITRIFNNSENKYTNALFCRYIYYFRLKKQKYNENVYKYWSWMKWTYTSITVHFYFKKS